MPVFVLLDVGLRPSAIAAALDLLPGDPERRVFRHPAFCHRPLKHRAQRIKKIPLPERRAVLLIDHALHMLAVQYHDAATVYLGAIYALVAVGFPKIL